MYLDMKFSFENAIDVCKNIYIDMYLYWAVINKWSNKNMRYMDLVYIMSYWVKNPSMLKKSLNYLRLFFDYKTF